MSVADKAFPSHFPEGCPGPDAEDAAGEYYLLVHDDPPTASAFQTNAEKRRRRNDDPCLRCGLSVWATQAAAADVFWHCQGMFGAEVRMGHLVARLQLSSADGKTMQTTRNRKHFTWWRYNSCDPSQTFREIVRNMRDDLAN